MLIIELEVPQARSSKSLGISFQDGLGALRDAREGVERMSREGGRVHQIQARARARKPAIAR